MFTRIVCGLALTATLFFAGCSGGKSSFDGTIDETGCSLNGAAANSARTSASASCTAPNPIFNDPAPSDFEPNKANENLAGSAGTSGQNLPDYLKGGINGNSNFGWGAGKIPFGNLGDVNDPTYLTAILSGPYGPMIRTMFGDITNLPTDWLARLQKWIRDGKFFPSNLRLRLLAVGTQNPNDGMVKVYRINSAKQPVEIASFMAFPSGGVNVAIGDVDGDGIADIVAGHASGDSDVIVFRGVISGSQGIAFAATARFTAYPGIPVGTYVATGDFNGDGRIDIITGAGKGGGPHVKVFSGADDFHSTTHSFMAYDTAFRGGVRVAAGDVNGDRISDVVTGAGEGGGPHIKAWRGVGTTEIPNLIESYFAYDASFRGGVFVACADFDNDGRSDLATGAGAGGGPHVKFFNGRSDATILSQFAYAENLTHGVAVTGGYLFRDRSPAFITGPATAANSPVIIYSWEKGSKLKMEAQVFPFPGQGVSLASGVSF